MGKMRKGIHNLMKRGVGGVLGVEKAKFGKELRKLEKLYKNNTLLPEQFGEVAKIHDTKDKEMAQAEMAYQVTRAQILLKNIREEIAVYETKPPTNSKDNVLSSEKRAEGVPA